jgi:hypothetical protein
MKRLARLSSLCAAALLAAAPAAAAVSDSLIGHWKLAETDFANLSVANSAPVTNPEAGTRPAGMLIGQAAPVGKGYYFDGLNRNDVVTLGASYADILRSSASLTISAWINPAFLRTPADLTSSGLANSRQVILATDFDFQFTLQGEGRVALIYWNPDKNGPGAGAFEAVYFDDVPPIETGKFTHLAVTFENDPDGFGDDVVTLFVNGVEQGKRYPFPSLATFATRSFDNLLIGRNQGNTARDFDGVISDLGLWSNRSLTGQQLAAIGALGLAGQHLSSPAVDQALALYAAASGGLATGPWNWSYTTSFAAAKDGSQLALGKSYYGTDDAIYVILGGSGGAWQGLKATGGVPFSIRVSITAEPADVSVNLNAPASFTVVAQSEGAVNYQWYFKPTANGDATEVGTNAATFSLPSVGLANEGYYYCIISEAAGDQFAKSRDARLIILNKPGALIHRWLLNETASQLATLSATYEPEAERVATLPLANQVVGAAAANYLKGAPPAGSTTVPGPIFSGPAAKGSLAAPGSVGSIGTPASSAAHVDGTRISLGNVAPTTNQFTVAFWFKRDGAGSLVGLGDQQHIINSNASSTQAGRWNLNCHLDGKTDGSYRARFFHNSATAWGQAGATNAFDVSSTLQSDVWYHFAMTRDGNNLFKLYLDGVKVHEASNPGTFSNASTGVILGRDPALTGRHFIGYFDDVRFYNGALTSEEILAMITAGAPAGFAGWQQANFTEAELADPAISGPNANPAGDGVANLLKYAFGLDPKVPAPAGSLPVVDEVEGSLTLTYTRSKSATDLAFIVEVTTDLITWETGPALVEVVDIDDLGASERVTVIAKTLPGVNNRGFMRLRVQQQP